MNLTVKKAIILLRWEWKKIFEQMNEKQIEHVIFIPTGLDTYINMLLELYGHLVRIVRKKKDIFC